MLHNLIMNENQHPYVPLTTNSTKPLKSKSSQALMLQTFCYHHFTHRKILGRMVPIANPSDISSFDEEEPSEV